MSEIGAHQRCSPLLQALFIIASALPATATLKERKTALKAAYDNNGREPSNLRYGYVAQPVADFSVFG